MGATESSGVISKRSDEVYRTLKHEILDWELPPGTPLSEPDLAQRLGASRTPIREALQRLAQEGLVRPVPRKGSFVADVSIPDIIELFQMRQALESYAARLAARSDEREGLGEFIPLLNAAREQLGDSQPAARDYYALTARMDGAIVALANNGRLAAALEHVWEQAHRARRLARANPDRLLDSTAEHIQIVEAILSGDEVAAAEAAHAHVDNSLDHVVRSMWPVTPGSKFSLQH